MKPLLHANTNAQAKMKGVTKEELGPIGRPAIPVQMRDTTAAVTPAQWEEEEEERRGSCTPADSIKTGLCMVRTREKLEPFELALTCG